MNLDIDLAFKAAIAAQEAFSSLLDPGEDPPDKRIHSGTSSEITETPEAYMVIECGELDHRAGNLHTGDVQFALYSSALSEDPAIEAAHRALSKALFNFLSDPGEVEAAFQSDTVQLLRKPFLTRPSQQQNDKRWIWQGELKCGFVSL